MSPGTWTTECAACEALEKNLSIASEDRKALILATEVIAKERDALKAAYEEIAEHRDDLKAACKAMNDGLGRLQEQYKAAVKERKEMEDRLSNVLHDAKDLEREMEEAKRLAKHWEDQWVMSNSERGTKTILAEGLKLELEREKRSHGEEVANLEEDLKGVKTMQIWYRAQIEALEKVALAAVKR